MQCHVIFSLTGERRSCEVEVDFRKERVLSGYWLDDASSLTSEECRMIETLYEETITKERKSLMEEDLLDRLRGK